MYISPLQIGHQFPHLPPSSIVTIDTHPILWHVLRNIKKQSLNWNVAYSAYVYGSKYHTMWKISQMLVTKLLNIWNWGWSYLFNGSTYIAYKSTIVTMIEVTRLHTNKPPPWVNLALLPAWTTHKLIPKQCHNHAIAYNCSLQLHS